MSKNIVENNSEKTTKKPISSNLIDNQNILKEKIGIGTSFDLGIRKLSVLDKEIQIYFLAGLCDIQYIIEILKELMFFKAL